MTLHLRSVLIPSSLALLAACAWPLSAPAQVQRCTGTDGTAVFTDRDCEVADGATQAAAATAGTPSGRFHRNVCARNLQDLVYEMASAIDSRDPNRLASVYHWAGMSGTNGYGVMSRLDELVQRPLVDIVPVMPGSARVDGNYYPQASVRQQPVALRVEQTLANSITPSSTVFGLQEHFGCWWIKG
ncbi:hypothetical protein [Lysobacter sp. D1-1-M9]|uniref:hypothetical protein n=1 Tax=Novilysobacter longmucuonensis TaxID=3098603 RepID=UPI002FC5C07A